MFEDNLSDEYLIELCYTMAELEGLLLMLPGLYNILGLLGNV
jgi:hypothetical protein